MPHTRSRTNQRAKVLFFCVYNKVLVTLQVEFDLVCTFEKITNK